MKIVKNSIKNIHNNPLIYAGIFIIITFCIYFLKTESSKDLNWKINTNQLLADFSNESQFKYLMFDEKNLYFSSTDGYVVSANKQNGKTNWKFWTEGISRYGINTDHKDLVIALSFDGVVYAINKKTGIEYWRFSTPQLIASDTPPFLSDQTVYFGSRKGILYALDANTGEKKWEKTIKEIDLYKHDTTKIIYRHFGKISIDENAIYINNPQNNALIAIDKNRGNILWKQDYQFRQGAPIINDKTISLFDNDGFLNTLDKTSGNFLRKTNVVDASKDNTNSQNLSTIYQKLNKFDLISIDKETGKTNWHYKSGGYISNVYASKDNKQAFITTIDSNFQGHLLSLNPLTGQIIWEIKSKYLFDSPITTSENITLVSHNGLSAYNQKDGSQLWNYVTNEKIHQVLPTENLVYLFTIDPGGIVTTHILEKQTGNEIYKYITKESISFSHADIDNDSVYFLNDQLTSITHLTGRKPVQAIPQISNNISDSKPSIQKEIINKIQKTISKVPYKKLFFFRKGQMEITNKTILPNKYDERKIIEISIQHNDDLYNNPWIDVATFAIFENEVGEKIKTNGFYYNKNMWKIRFKPPSSGDWNYKVILKNPYGSISKKGSINADIVIPQDPINISSSNPYRLTNEKGIYFNLIGLQDCILDRNHDNNPINQWSLGSQETPSNFENIKYVSIDEYLKTYGPEGAGFNLWRWNIDNCSNKLWKKISHNEFRLSINDGIWGDQLAKTLKNNGYIIWMSILGFESPFINLEKDSINQDYFKLYLNYVVSRYSSFIDIWELANESTLSDEWVSFAANYIKSIDPYHHPITINWEKPNHPNIDIISTHWYQTEETSLSDLILRQKVNSLSIWEKPIVFSEQGNKHANWDESSAIRMRIRTWTAFFNQATLIFWNTSDALYQPENSAGNIYLGPTERKYIRVLQDFTSQLNPDIKKFDIKTTNPHARVYSYASHNSIIAYFINNSSSTLSTSFNLEIDKRGIIEWIDPSTGQVISTKIVDPGTQTLITPQFLIDTVLKIKFD